MKYKGLIRAALIFVFGILVGFLWGHEVGWVQSRNNVCAMIIMQKPGLAKEFPNACPIFKARDAEEEAKQDDAND